jgi:hypothetical protein
MNVHAARFPLISDTTIAICLFALPFFLYLPGMEPWWVGDDTQILKHVAGHPFPEYLLSPTAWRELSANNLTPWVDVLFDADLRLFGLNPPAFYLHHIAVSGVLAAVVYFFLRLWLLPLGAFAGSCLFVMSPCYANNVYLLMTRHYIEGLLWSLCAVLLYVKALREGRLLPAWAGAALYLLAALCKEIYVPLVVILPFWPGMDLGKEKTGWMSAVANRSLYVAPFVAVALAYTLYRRWMLGVWIGGYGSLSAAGADFTTVWGRAGHLLMPEGTWTIVAVFAFGAWGLWGKREMRWRRTGLALLIALLVLAPLASITAMLSARHLFLPTFMFVAAASAGLSLLWNRGPPGRLIGVLGGVLLFLGLFQANRGAQAALENFTQRYAVQGLFVWEVGTGDDALLVDSIPAWYFDGLSWLRAFGRQGETGDAARPIIDVCNIVYASGSFPQFRRFWTYDHRAGAMVEVDSAVVGAAIQRCESAYHPDIVLDIRIWADGGTIRWELGPYEQGRYFLVDPSNGSSITLPRTGHVPGTMAMMGATGERHFCFAAPEGWTGCSTWTAAAGTGE